MCGCEPLGVQVRDAIRRGFSLLGHGKIDEDLGVFLQVVGFKERLQHAILHKDKVFSTVGWGFVNDRGKVVVAGGDVDGACPFGRNVSVGTANHDGGGPQHFLQGFPHAAFAYDDVLGCLCGGGGGHGEAGGGGGGGGGLFWGCVSGG
jgi:hypothetical protein